MGIWRLYEHETGPWHTIIVLLKADKLFWLRTARDIIQILSNAALATSVALAL
jgi:hypothetical protein